MKVVQTHRYRAQFKPITRSAKAQAAIMILPPNGKSDSELSNELPRSEQWLYVIAGVGSASIVARNGSRRRVRLRSGSLLVIERGELHQIKNVGKRALNTITFYVPAAYRSDGSLLRRSKPKR